MARLAHKEKDYIQKNRKKIAETIAKKYNVVVALKGANTVVASPSGILYVNRTGGPGMASAGSGDVLTGIISALLGQGLDGWTAAKTGAYLHGLAGDLAAKEKTQAALIASDIIDHIPEGIKKLRKQL